MSWAPHLTVAAIVERQGRFLMVEECVENAAVFNQPAGHLEDGESLLDAAVRETLEETGRRFTPRGLIGIYRWRHPYKPLTYVRVAFCGEVSEPEAERMLDEGIIRSLWMTRDELARQPHRLRSPLVLPCIDDYRRGVRYPPVGDERRYLT